MMNQENTPEIGPVLKKSGIRAIPEAHCYLRFQSDRYDFTKFDEPAQPTPHLQFVYEESIQPEQIGDYKNKLHRHWLDQWAQESEQRMTADELWLLREECITALSTTNTPTPAPE